MWRKRLSGPRCRSELIDSAWVVIVPGQKCIKNYIVLKIFVGENDEILKFFVGKVTKCFPDKGCPAMYIFSVKTSLHGNKEEQNIYKRTIVAYMLVGNNNKKRKERNQNKRKIISSRLKLNVEIKWLFGT